MSEWKKVRLGEVLSIKHGYAFPGEGIVSEDNGVVLVTPGNFLIGGGFKESGKKFFRGDYPSEYQFAGGELVVTMTDLSKTSDTLGVSAKIPFSKRCVYLHNQRIGLVTITDKSADEDFIYWFMRTDQYRKVIVAGASGTTVKHTSPSRIRDVELRLPPLPTQRKIAAVLGALDDKIENNRKICANLEAQAQAIFKSWFVDFEPFGGKMPQGWKMGKLGDVAECNKDSYTSKEGWSFTNYLDTGSITKNQIQDIQQMRMSEAPSRARRKVKRLSIVYSTVRPNQCHYGILHEIKENMLVSTGFAVIDAKDPVSSYRLFLDLTQDCVTKQFQTLAEQSVCTYPAINPADILAHSVVIPSLAVEQEFYSIVSQMFEKIDLANQQSRSLAAMRDALLPKLMSGEIDVEKVKVA